MSMVRHLNEEVSRAIRIAERLEDTKSMEAPAAFALVSVIEQCLAHEHPFGGAEWMLAWRGAVRAAVKAGNIERANILIEHLHGTRLVGARFITELRKIVSDVKK